MPSTKNKNERKVYYGHYKPLNRRMNIYPVIRLGGKYLKQSGFDIGDAIDVTVENELITIRKIHKEEEELRAQEMQGMRAGKEQKKDRSQSR